MISQNSEAQTPTPPSDRSSARPRRTDAPHRAAQGPGHAFTRDPQPPTRVERAYGLLPSLMSVTTHIKPSVKGKHKAENRNEGEEDRNPKECNSIDQRAKPEGRVLLPKTRARAVKSLRRRRKRQVAGLLCGEFTEGIERPRSPMDFSHCFEQQVL